MIRTRGVDRAVDRTERYVALLRGINVGGANVIPMTALRASFEALGLLDVTSFIQSGNVLFRSKPADASALASRIERALSKEFGYTATVVLRSHAQMKTVVRRAPDGFGASPHLYRYDVVFVKEPLVPRTVVTTISTREGVDTAEAGSSVIYFSRLIARASQSHLTKLVSMPVYKQLTIRNWNTTTKLLTLMDA
jgi:uncharacterized protein (DUF1697 family)